MQIRTKLTLQLLAISGLITVLASIAIYYFSADYRKDDFYRRLENRAITIARLFIDVEEVDSTLLLKIERDNPLSLPEERISIFDYRNSIIFSTESEKKIEIDSSQLDQVRLNSRVRFRNGSLEGLGTMFTGRYDRFVVIAAANDIYGHLKLKNLRTILILVVLGSLILFSVAGWFYAGKALAPISSVVDQVERITATRLNLRLDEGNRKDEIARLAQTFNKMLGRLEEAFRLQKDFISNASHELRNPLTSLYIQLEVLLMKERPASDYKESISSVLEDLRQLSDIANRLLLLAQASSEPSTYSFMPVRIDEILWQSRDEIQSTFSDYRVNIAIGDSTVEERMNISGDETLLKIAFINLFENGCKYSSDHTVNVSLEYDNERVMVVVSDRGLGIPEEDLPHIFEPFYRGRNVKSLSGSGIGLPLVYQIISNHNGKIDISSKVDQGTSIRVSLRYS